MSADYYHTCDIFVLPEGVDVVSEKVHLTAEPIASPTFEFKRVCSHCSSILPIPSYTLEKGAI